MNSILKPNQSNIHKSQYFSNNSQTNNKVNKNNKDNISSSINFLKKKSSKKILGSRKSSYSKNEENILSQMMKKRKSILEKKLLFNKKSFLNKSLQKNNFESTSYYPSLQNNKIPNPVLKRRSKVFNETSLMQNAIFPKKSSVTGSTYDIPTNNIGYSNIINASKNHLMSSQNYYQKKENKINNQIIDEPFKVKSQDKYLISREKFLERSKKLNKSLQNLQNKSQQKKVIFLFLKYKIYLKA